MSSIISTDNAPKAIGPYSQAVCTGGLVFTSGQIALDPQTGALVGGDITAQTRQVCGNIKALLEAAGRQGADAEMRDPVSFGGETARSSSRAVPRGAASQ